jgi:hypothetical protein
MVIFWLSENSTSTAVELIFLALITVWSALCVCACEKDVMAERANTYRSIHPGVDWGLHEADVIKLFLVVYQFAKATDTQCNTDRAAKICEPVAKRLRILSKPDLLLFSWPDISRI